jgi:drug/metabolite transporter (DMT)-like permease
MIHTITLNTLMLPAIIVKRQHKIYLMLVTTFIASTGQLLLKVGVDSFNSQGFFRNYYLFSGIALYAFAAVLFLIALRHIDLSVAYPIISLSFVWVALLSMQFLGEQISFLQWTGIFSILLGVSFIGGLFNG